MDPKLVFWTAAMPIFAGIVATAFAGWRAIGQKDVQAHKRYMTASVSLVLFFVAAYVAKVLGLGKEELELWSSEDRAVLWTHETFVFSMVVAGTIARLLARKLDPDRSTPYRPFYSHDEIQKVKPGEIVPVEIEIWPTSVVCEPGERLLLEVAAHDEPRTTPFLHDDPRDRVYARKITLHTGGRYDSHLLLPVIPER